ncbi:MAG: hypothetical protein Q8K68_08595 [Nitrospirota bacterium]|nr:hypothetical protein [Nitrospirota bacterium]
MKKEDSEIQAAPPVFIVSTGRAGCTMLGIVLSVHPSLCVFNNINPSLRTEAFIRWEYPKRSKEIEKRVRDKREKLVSQVKRNRLVYVESSTAAPMLIDELDSLFHAKFVHLYRDGRTFLRSGMEREWYKSEQFSHSIKTILRRRFFVETGRSTTDTLLTPPPGLATRFEKIAWRWMEINRVILESLAALPPERTFSFRLEDAGRKSFGDLLDFLGVGRDEVVLQEMLKLAESRPNRTKRFTNPSPQEWPEWEKRRFDKIAGGIMTKLGYYV